MKENYSYAGRSYPINDAVYKTTGEMIYASDIRLPGMLYLELACSTHPHARIRAVDSRAARRLRGVVEVFSYENSPHKRYNNCRKTPLQQGVPEDKLLYTDRARYVGDVVAGVLAESREAAEEGARRLVIDYEDLPAAVSMSKSTAPDACPVHDGGNILCNVDFSCGGGTEAGLTESGRCRSSLSSQQMNHITMETHAYLADYRNGELTIWTPTQGIYGVRTVVCDLFGLPYNMVRVVKVPMGGSFGGKQEFIYEPHAAYAALQSGRPVRLHLSRRQAIVSTTCRPSLETAIEMGFTKEGRITECHVLNDANAGAYAGNAVNLEDTMKAKMTRSYKFPSFHFKGRAIYTNTPIGGGMRGWGAPEMVTPLEIFLNAAARRLGLDPVELRLRNTYDPGDSEIAHGLSLGNCRGKDCLTIGAKEFSWDERRKRPREKGRLRRGIGVAYGGYQNGFYPRPSNLSVMTIKMNEDGSVCLQTSVHEVGCGTVRSLQIIAAEILSVAPDKIYVTEGDTKYTQFDLGSYGSRTTFIAGECARRAALALKDSLLKAAASLLGLPETELELRDEYVISASHPEVKMSYAEAASRALMEKGVALYDAVEWKGVSNPGSFVANFAEAEVDTLTGMVRVTDFLSVNDVGFALNRQMVENQVRGGIQMAAGYALCEDVAVDAAGNPKNDRLSRYHTLNSADMPRVRVVLVEEGGDEGPFGAKTIGEVCTIAGTAAIASAVSDALGKEITALPLTPERIVKWITTEGVPDDDQL